MAKLDKHNQPEPQAPEAQEAEAQPQPEAPSEAAEAPEAQGGNRTEEVHVCLNEETGLGGYVFEDGKSMMADRIYSLSEKDYDRYAATKIEVGGGRSLAVIRKY
jgi:hypothetical protein